MPDKQPPDEQTRDVQPNARADFYCPQCDRPVGRPLRCGDCGSLLCPQCGAPVEQADELGIG